MSRPQLRILPELGFSAPAIMLNRVVLPAPFGPMKPKICPLRTSKLTSLTAARPPKYRVILSNCSIGTLAFSTESPDQFAQATQAAAGLEEDDADQERPVPPERALRVGSND